MYFSGNDVSCAVLGQNIINNYINPGTKIRYLLHPNQQMISGRYIDSINIGDSLLLTILTNEKIYGKFVNIPSLPIELFRLIIDKLDSNDLLQMRLVMKFTERYC